MNNKENHPAKRKIHIIEDDTRIREELTALLTKYGYECSSEADFTNTAENAINSGADAILLDINLPESDGFMICKKLRERTTAPILMVTCRDTDADELLSMHFGADGYITKPYNPHILLARLEALLRRAFPAASAQKIERAGLELDLTGGQVIYKGNIAELTKNEHKILRILMEADGDIVSRERLISALWDTDDFIDDNTLTVNVNRLRAKLSSLGLDGYIKTKRGEGYRV